MKSNFMLKVRTRVLTFLNLVKTDFRILTDSVSELWFSFFRGVHCQDGERILVAHLTSTAPHSPADYSRSHAQIHVSWFLFGRKCSFFFFFGQVESKQHLLCWNSAGLLQGRESESSPGVVCRSSLILLRGKRRRGEGGISQGRDEVFKQGRKVF